jgi:hypothetical protein
MRAKGPDKTVVKASKADIEKKKELNAVEHAYLRITNEPKSYL